MIHVRCPYAEVWDYYDVQFSTDEFVKCEKFQDVCEQVRGQTLSQEDATKFIGTRLFAKGTLIIKGTHGQNSRLKTVMECDKPKFPGAPQ